MAVFLCLELSTIDYYLEIDQTSRIAQWFVGYFYPLIEILPFKLIPNLNSTDQNKMEQILPS